MLYLLSNSTPPTKWYDTPQTMTVTNKYLWNYETITYSNNTTKDTDKRVIGVYGSTGKGISKVTNYYLATSFHHLELQHQHLDGQKTLNPKMSRRLKSICGTTRN